MYIKRGISYVLLVSPDNLDIKRCQNTPCLDFDSHVGVLDLTGAGQMWYMQGHILTELNEFLFFLAHCMVKNLETVNFFEHSWILTSPFLEIEP